MAESRGSAVARGMTTTAAATIGFGLVHSALASHGAKRVVESAIGTRWRNAAYRPLYIAQSVVTLAALAAIVSRAPYRTLYRARGAPAALLHALRGAGLVWAFGGARRVGLSRITGLAGLVAWARGAETVPREPEAQGPSPDEAGELDTGGPFALSRHPLNLSPLPVLWLVPRMTTRWLAFAATCTVYLVVGSRHEEVRLRAVYGRRYERYRRSVPFYLPGRGRTGSRPAAAPVGLPPQSRVQSTMGGISPRRRAHGGSQEGRPSSPSS